MRITLQLECDPSDAAFVLAFYILLHAKDEDDMSSGTISNGIEGVVLLAAALRRFTGDGGWSDSASEQEQLDYIRNLSNIKY